jgi:hypothetical protein
MADEEVEYVTFNIHNEREEPAKEKPTLKLNYHYAAMPMDFMLREVYEQSLNEQLRFNSKVFGSFEERPPLTRWQKFTKKWKKFWNHIPDFMDYVKEYKYEYWRYWDKDGY